MYAVKTELHLDELKGYALRGAERLAPGARVILGHVPTLERPDLEDHRQIAYGSIVTVVEVGWKTFAELHPKVRNPIASEPDLVMIYDDGRGGESIRYQHLSDSGITPYTGGFHNPVNFAVLMEDLDAHGFEPLLTVSPEYELKLARFNEQVHERSYLYEDYDY